MTILVIIFFIINCIFLGSCVLFSRICYKHYITCLNVLYKVQEEHIKVINTIQNYLNYENEHSNTEHS